MILRFTKSGKALLEKAEVEAEFEELQREKSRLEERWTREIADASEKAEPEEKARIQIQKKFTTTQEEAKEAKTLEKQLAEPFEIQQISSLKIRLSQIDFLVSLQILIGSSTEGSTTKREDGAKPSRGRRREWLGPDYVPLRLAMREGVRNRSKP